MNPTNKDLLSVLDAFSGKKILVVGDVIVDHYIWGKVERISPEAPVVVVDSTEEEKRLGGAGNVVRNILSLGADVTLCAVVGDDERRAPLIAMLEEAGADASGIVTVPGRMTTQKSRIIAHRQQVVRVDREDTSALSAQYQAELAAFVRSQIPKVDAIIVSDYAKGAICPPIFDVFAKAKADGLVGLGKKAIVVDPKMPNFSLYSSASVIKPNKKEAEEASGRLIRSRQEAIAAGTILLERWNTDALLITLGEMGMVLLSRTTNGVASAEIDTVAQEVFDVSGAGDTVSAVFALALATGAAPQRAAMLANIAAGIVVAEVGTVAITADELRAELV